MIGRGMVVNPGLALSIATPGHAGLPWHELLPLIAEFWALVSSRIEPRKRAGRIKQWLNFLRRHYPQAEEAYARVRTLDDPRLVSMCLFGEPTGTAFVDPLPGPGCLQVGDRP
jgi:tRNA-dihydrouridine synthase C